MTRISTRPAPLVTVALLMAGAAAAFPSMGQFSITPGLAAALVSPQDFKDIYGPGLNVGSSPVALSLGGGIDYNLSDAVQLGARFDRVLKAYKVEVTNPAGNLVETHTWRIGANGILGHARFLIKGSNPARWFAISLLLGQYALSGATLKVENPGGGAATLDLSGSAFGGEVALEAEKSFGGQVAGTLMLGYRFAKITDVTTTIGGVEARLLNDDGSNAALDLGGLNVGVGLRFYFGGSGSSVTSM